MDLETAPFKVRVAGPFWKLSPPLTIPIQMSAEICDLWNNYYTLSSWAVC